jgi:predicted metal-dependent hydrolase
MIDWTSVIFTGPRRRRKASGKRRTVSKGEKQKYQLHRESARKKISEVLSRVNAYYGLQYGRVAIRNQRRSWGSCSQVGNLNFNYRILFLPEALQEYIVAHELCHLKEFNHGPGFWRLVAEYAPDYHQKRKELKSIAISSL